MTSGSVKEDIERALDRIKQDDPDFRYEIEMPPPAEHKVFRVVMEPFDLPRDEYIVGAVTRHFRTVTGREPDAVGTVLPGAYSGDDTCHLWKAGVPCVLYGPGGASESDTIPDEYSRIDDMEQVARVLALTRPGRLQPSRVIRCASFSPRDRPSTVILSPQCEESCMLIVDVADRLNLGQL